MFKLRRSIVALKGISNNIFFFARKQSSKFKKIHYLITVQAKELWQQCSFVLV